MKKNCSGCGAPLKNDACSHCGTLDTSSIKVKSNHSTIKVSNSHVVGNFNKIYGDNNTITGNFNTVYGNGNVCDGNMNKIKTVKKDFLSRLKSWLKF